MRRASGRLRQIRYRSCLHLPEYGGCIEAFLIHDDGLLGDGLAVLQLLDDVIDVGSLERIALSIVVPVACLQFFQSHLLQSKPITITSLPTPWEILALSRAATAP